MTTTITFSEFEGKACVFLGASPVMPETHDIQRAVTVFHKTIQQMPRGSSLDLRYWRYETKADHAITVDGEVL